MLESAEPSRSEAAKLPTGLGTVARNALVEQQWRLIRPLGSGPLGATWLARDTTLDRSVAVKFLDLQLARDEAFAAAFLAQAQKLAAVEHRNLWQILAVGRFEGTPYLVSRIVEGCTLAEHLHLHQGRLAPGAARALLLQLCNGLSALHCAGLAHGNLKLSNILISPEGHLTLIGAAFGRRPGADERWCAPEVRAGGALEPRADLFGLGHLGFELLAGRAPEHGGDRLPASVPAELATTLAACLSEAREDRPPDARAVSLGLLGPAASPMGGLPRGLKLPAPHAPEPERADAQSQPTAPTLSPVVDSGLEPSEAHSRPTAPALVALGAGVDEPLEASGLPTAVSLAPVAGPAHGSPTQAVRAPAARRAGGAWRLGGALAAVLSAGVVLNLSSPPEALPGSVQPSPISGLPRPPPAPSAAPAVSSRALPESTELGDDELARIAHGLLRGAAQPRPLGPLRPGILRVRSFERGKPRRALLFIDGVRRGFTPLDVPLSLDHKTASPGDPPVFEFEVKVLANGYPPALLSLPWAHGSPGVEIEVELDQRLREAR